MKRSSSNTPFTGKYLLAIVVTLAVAAAVIAGLFAVGSPTGERIRRMDEQRVSDLQNISYAIDQYYASIGALPAALEDAATRPDAYVQRITDPETGMAYTYEPTNSTSYRLCASFAAATPAVDARNIPAELSFWNHAAGNTCYTLDVRSLNPAPKPLPIQP